MECEMMRSLSIHINIERDGERETDREHTQVWAYASIQCGMHTRRDARTYAYVYINVYIQIWMYASAR